MSFDDLPVQSPYVSEGAKNYFRTTMAESRKAVQSCRCSLDVAYGSDYWQKIDIYLPADTNAVNLPVIAYLHGGGWQRGYKEQMAFMAPPLISLPAIFISVSYRLAPEVLYPALLDDTVSAVEWIWRNIATYGGSRDKITIGGHSAGAHLSALAALRPKLFTERGLPADTIKYCFPVSGTFNFDAVLDADRVRDFMKGPEQIFEASPLNHVAGNRVPFYITWAANDLPNILRTSEPMIEALRKEPAPVDFDRFENMDHFDISMDHGRSESRWVQVVRKRLAEM